MRRLPLAERRAEVPPGLPPRRWPTFVGVGALGFAVQLGVLEWLTHYAGVATALGAALAVEAAVLHNFAWHERWTWRDRASDGPMGVLWRLARFHAGVGIVSVAGNVALTVALVECLQLPILLANTCTVAVLSVLNFQVADRYVFS